jgi:hypothetical protein
MCCEWKLTGFWENLTGRIADALRGKLAIGVADVNAPGQILPEKK